MWLWDYAPLLFALALGLGSAAFVHTFVYTVPRSGSPDVTTTNIIGPKGEVEVLIDCAEARDCVIQAGVSCPLGYEFKNELVWAKQGQRGLFIIKCNSGGK
jgi:hypothetical protein